MMSHAVLKTHKDDISNAAVSLRSRLIHGTKWSLAGAAVVQGLGLASSIIVAQFLGKESFGQYGIIQSTVAMFGVFAGIAMGTTATKHVAEYRTSDPVRAGRFMGLPILMGLISSLAVTIVLIIFSGYVSKYILAEPALKSMILISAPLLVLNTLNGIQMASLAGLEAFKELAIANTITGILSFPCIFIGVWAWGLTGAIGGLVLSRAFTYVILQIYLRIQCKKNNIILSYKGLRAEWPNIWSFSIPTFLAGTILGPANWFCNVLLVNMPGGYAQMGIYNATIQWQSAIRFAPLRILDVTLPVLSNLHGTKDHTKFYKVLIASMGCIIGISVLVCLPLMIFSKFIMAAFGKGFSEGNGVLNLMLIAAVLHMIARILSQVAISRGKAWMDFIFSSILAASTLCTWLFMTSKGAFGLAAAGCIGYFIMNCGLILYVLAARKKDIGNIKKGG